MPDGPPQQSGSSPTDNDELQQIPASEPNLTVPHYAPDDLNRFDSEVTVVAQYVDTGHGHDIEYDDQKKPQQENNVKK